MSHAWEIEPNRNAKVFCGIPITPSFKFQHVIALTSWDNCAKPEGSVRIFEPSFGVANAREKLVEAFLKTDCTHFLLLDSDIVLMQDTIARMLMVDKTVVVGRYHETSPQAFPEVFHHSEVPFRRDAPVDFKLNEILEYPEKGEDVLLAGLGIMMVKRELFELLEAPYFMYSSDLGIGIDDYHSVSEDFYFCIKIQDKYISTITNPKDKNSGDPRFKIYYYPNIWVWHIGEAIVGDGGRVAFI